MTGDLRVFQSEEQRQTSFAFMWNLAWWCFCGCIGRVNGQSSILGRALYGILYFLIALVLYVVPRANLTSLDERAKLLCQYGTTLAKPFGKAGEAASHALQQLCQGMVLTYRVVFALVVFHALMALVLLRTRQRDDPRRALHLGWWLPKLVVIALLILLSFLIPDTFFVGFRWFALGGAVIFVGVQVLLLLSAAYGINQWLSRYLPVALTVTGLAYLLVLGAHVVFFAWLTPSCAGVAVPLLIAHLVVIALVTLLPIPRFSQHCMPRVSILTSALVALYTTPFAYAALAGTDHCLESPWFHSADLGLAGAALTLALLVYAAFRNAHIQPDQQGQEAVDDEDENAGIVSYDYSFFHLVFLLAYCYLAMALTNWMDPHATSGYIDHGATATWIRISSIVLTYVLYTGTLFIPYWRCEGRRVHPSRDDERASVA